MLFTDEELASYPGVESFSEGTVTLLRDLVESRIYRVLPQPLADVSLEAKGIALEVVARALRNPNGYAAENVDDYGYRRPTATSASGVYLTADEKAELAALNPDTARPRVRSVRLRSWSAPDL